MIFHENCLLVDDSHEISYLIIFRKLGKMQQNSSLAAVEIGASRVKYHFHVLLNFRDICYHFIVYILFNQYCFFVICQQPKHVYCAERVRKAPIYSYLLFYSFILNHFIT